MKKINIYVDFDDKEYSYALSRALALSSDSFNLLLNNDLPSDAFIVNSDNAPLYSPVSKIVSMIMANNQYEKKPAKLISNITFTAFTSAIGGSGLTSCALFYSRIASRLFGRKVSFVSFDPSYRQDFSGKDEFDVHYIRNTDLFIDKINADLLSDIDELVLDVPFNAEGYYDWLDMSERRVVVMGFNEARRFSNESFFNDLEKLADKYIDPPKNYKLYNDQDIYMESNDIHGQLGNQILSLIRENEI